MHARVFAGLKISKHVTCMQDIQLGYVALKWLDLALGIPKPVLLWSSGTSITRHV
jgi:hypothetical protein